MNIPTKKPLMRTPARPKSSPRESIGLRGKSMIFSWKGKSKSIEEALASRDMELTNELLAAARRIYEIVESPDEEKAESLALHLFCGRYEAARRVLKKVVLSTLALEDAGRFLEHINLLKKKIPREDLPLTETIAREVDEVLSSISSADPFPVQERLIRLMWRIESAGVPKTLSRFQVRLSKKASWQARRQGESRRGPVTRPVQEGRRDSWVRSIYDLPIPVLEPLRRTISYDEFLKKVEAEFPGKDFGREDLTFDEYPKLLERMGFQTRQFIVTREDLEDLLECHHAVIAGLAWFDEDVSEMEAEEARDHWTKHFAIIKGFQGSPEAREFEVWDPLKPYETRYMMTELGLLQLLVFTVEPLEADSGEILRHFITQSGGPDSPPQTGEGAAQAEAALAEQAGAAHAGQALPGAAHAGQTQAGQPQASHDPVATEIIRLGGKFERDEEHPRQPVVSVDLSYKEGAVTDATLVLLKGLKSLRRLDLTLTRITAAGLVQLKDLHNLQALSLNATPVTDAGLAHLSGLEGLLVLSLIDTSVTDAGLVHLEPLKNLLALNLAGTPVTDAGLVHLEALPYLQELYLYETAITDAGLAHLKELKMLQKLDVHLTWVTESGILDLKEAVPGVTIHYQPLRRGE
jgi:hypothetical protein